MQSNIMTSSSESLPPPPAYLLDSTGRTSPGKVCETVKALTELNHMPASPSVLRRAVAQMNSSPPQVNLIGNETIPVRLRGTELLPIEWTWDMTNTNHFDHSKFLWKSIFFYLFLHFDFPSNVSAIQTITHNALTDDTHTTINTPQFESIL